MEAVDGRMSSDAPDSGRDHGSDHTHRSRGRAPNRASDRHPTAATAIAAVAELSPTRVSLVLWSGIGGRVLIAPCRRAREVSVGLNQPSRNSTRR